MNFLISILLKTPVAGSALALLAKAYGALTGFRTEICAVLVVVVYALGFFSVITNEQAESIIATIGGPAAVFLAQKVKRHQDLISKLGSAVENAALDKARLEKEATAGLDAATSEALKNLESPDGKS
jgi:hypothetical protein